MDFTRDANDFLSYITTVKRDWDRASSELLDLVEHWQDLSMKHFTGMTSIAAKERSIEGEVLGKQFSIEINPISRIKLGWQKLYCSCAKSEVQNRNWVDLAFVVMERF